MTQAHAQIPQQVFLPPNGPDCRSTPAGLGVATTVNPQGKVANYWIDNKNHSVVQFDQGVFQTVDSCSAGVVGVDGTCICPGSANTPPFSSTGLSGADMKHFFAPPAPARMSLTPEARYLAAQRRPIAFAAKPLDGYYQSS